MGEVTAIMRHRTAGSGLWIVIPTYNEADNLAKMVECVMSVVPAAHILVVDDGSPDGTGDIADRMRTLWPQVLAMHRRDRAGLGSAYRAGFEEVLRRPDCLRVAQMDCDFSHDPSDLPRLLAAMEYGADLVIGSRYVDGGGTPNWSLRRRILSRGGSTYARMVLGLPIRDLTGGFRVWDARLLRTIDFKSAIAKGYGFQIEMAWRASRAHAHIREIPIVFHERAAGASKMSAMIALEAAVAVLRMRLYQLRARGLATTATELDRPNGDSAG